MLARELTPKRWPLPAVESTSVIVTLRAFAGELAMAGRGLQARPYIYICHLLDSDSKARGGPRPAKEFLALFKVGRCVDFCVRF